MKKAGWVRRTWALAGGAAVVLILAGYVGHRFVTHTTPTRALAVAHEPVTGVVESVPFNRGLLMVSEIPHEGPGASGFNGWYLTRNFWGWHVDGYGQVETNVGGTPIDWSPVTAHRKTLLWGVTERPMKTVILSQHGRSFSAAVGTAGLWHMTVPFDVGVIYNNQWAMRLSTGKTVPMYPGSGLSK